MSARVIALLILTCTLVVIGCGRQEDRSSVSSRESENSSSVGSLSVEVHPMAEETPVRSRINLKFNGRLRHVPLPKGGGHALFTTNGRYLAWLRSYTDTLCVYDLRHDRMIRKMRLPRGKGPGEFDELSGAAITADNIVHLAEPNQAKFLRIHATEGPMEDLTFRESGFRPVRVVAQGDQLVSTSMSPTEFVGVVGSDRVFQSADGLDAASEFSKGSFFSQSGRLDATRQRAFFLTRYLPRIYVFDPRRNQFVKTIVYADVEVEMPEPEETERGMTVHRPPQKVPLLSRNVVAVPGRPNRVLIQAEGGDGQHTFDPSALYEIDVQTGTIVAEHDLGVTIESVAAADSSLFVYDDEKREVFAYRLRPGK